MALNWPKSLYFELFPNIIIVFHFRTSNKQDWNKFVPINGKNIWIICGRSTVCQPAVNFLSQNMMQSRHVFEDRLE